MTPPPTTGVAEPHGLDLAHHLSLANRILVRHGVLDAFGHISVRAPDGDGFLLSRNLAPELVTPEDVLSFDAWGHTTDERRVYVETPLHAAIYRSRPDVRAVLHSHSPGIVTLGVSATPMVAVSHMASFLGLDTPVFDIADEFGDATDLLIRDDRRADALAETLGSRAYCLLRGHGSVAVGETIAEAVFRGVYAEVNASILLRAAALGPVRALSPSEAEAVTITNQGQIGRAWDHWARQVERG